MGAKRGKMTDEGVAGLLRKHAGNMAAVGRAYGVRRQSVRDYLETRPDLRALADEYREAVVDDAEEGLTACVRRHEPWAITLALKTLGKSRGYVERQEVSGPGGGPVEVHEIVVRTREEAAQVLRALGAAEVVSG